jgi:hypothetical protein
MFEGSQFECDAVASTAFAWLRDFASYYGRKARKFQLSYNLWEHFGRPFREIPASEEAGYERPG